MHGHNLSNNPDSHARSTQRAADKSQTCASDNASASAPAERQRPVYHISIVAEIVATHPQTLRTYERMGLVSPQRTRNNVRLYSEDDVEQVRRIQHLTQELGVNLAGVEVVFKLLQEIEKMRQEIEAQAQRWQRGRPICDCEN